MEISYLPQPPALHRRLQQPELLDGILLAFDILQLLGDLPALPADPGDDLLLLGGEAFLFLFGEERGQALGFRLHGLRRGLDHRRRPDPVEPFDQEPLRSCLRQSVGRSISFRRTAPGSQPSWRCGTLPGLRRMYGIRAP